MYNGVKEFLLDNLRKATDEQRAAAKNWVKREKQTDETAMTPEKAQAKLKTGISTSRVVSREKRVRTLAELDRANNARFDELRAMVRALEEKLDRLVPAK